MSKIRYMTVQDAATALSCSDQTIRRLIKSKKLPALVLSKDYRINEADLSALSYKPKDKGAKNKRK
jgi:excisionase family DNA binding protein